MKKLQRAVVFMIIFAAAIAIFALDINLAVIRGADEYILTNYEAMDTDADCIIVPGAGLLPDGTPNRMLIDRLDKAIELYESGAASRIIMSGDHGQPYYDEVNAMKDYATGKGVPEDDVFMDHAGFSTYETIYRAKAIFKVERPIIVTQKYHLYRAVYIARSFGLEAYGVDAHRVTYTGQKMRDVREVAARIKDFFSCIFKPEPTYLGEEIPISSNVGGVTAG